MKRLKVFYVALYFTIALFGGLTTSCSDRLMTTSVTYQSIRTTFRQPVLQEIPQNSEIVVTYAIDPNGIITPYVENRTSEVMIIDNTKSFFVNTNGKSVAYYDPTVKTTTVTDVSSSTRGGSVNLGAVGSAIGVGGVVGKILNGVNVGGSNTNGTSESNTTYSVEQPQISLAPRSEIAMPKNFYINGIGNLEDMPAKVFIAESNTAEKRFSVCITYSVDNGLTFKKIVTDFFVNSEIVVPIKQYGQTNSCLREIYSIKPDAIYEPLWILWFNYNINHGCNRWLNGLLYDYQ